MQRLDERDISDEARRWASDESEERPDLVPSNTGEWQATMEIAFEAGRRYQALIERR
jgi:hypothetical protein